MNTQPFFIVSSGRSGTQMMERLLGAMPDVEMHHEYLCTHVQPLAVRYYLGLVDDDTACERLREWHGAAVHYCRRPLFGDSSNKLSWLIEPLERLFPEARFIHLVRDGRKVVSSYLHKLGDECYDDVSTAALQAWVDDPENNPAPPPEKRYWWNVPRPGTSLAQAFRTFDQFQRICFHWAEVNRFITSRLAAVDPARRRVVRLEDLTRNPAVVRELLGFLGLEYHEHHFEALRRPHNVSVPRDFPLTDAQTEQFWALCGGVMAEYGYNDSPEYRVAYHPEEVTT